MTIPRSLAKQIEKIVGHIEVPETRYHMGANGTVHINGSVTMYQAPKSEYPQRIGWAKIDSGALWLTAYSGMTHMIPIDGD
ncbi:MAG: hypothetical protein WCS15_06350 [Prevotella sp.]